MNEPKWWKAALLSSAVGLALTGCAANDAGQSSGTEGVQQEGIETYDISKNRRVAGNRDLGPLRNDRTDMLRAADPNARPFYNPLTNERLSMRELQNDMTVETNDELAEQIAAMDEVKRASVLQAGGNAYVAVVVDAPGDMRPNPMRIREYRDPDARGLENRNTIASDLEFGEEMSVSIKSDIARRVKALNPSINNVYVSANPNFLQRFDNIADSLREGRPAEGIIDEFIDMVNRVSPMNADRSEEAGRQDVRSRP